jgi:chromosome segregation ATPase
MWPRLIAQLVDLLPHATRLLPLADNYFSTRRESDRAQAAAMAALGDGLRDEMGKLAAANSGLTRQLGEQKQQIASLQESLETAQTNSIAQTRQLEWITSDLNTVRIWVKFGIVFIVVLLLALVGVAILALKMR